MNIHEYQAKELLSARGVAVPAGEVVANPADAGAAAARVLAAGARKLAVKAQIQAGGRGKGTFKSGYKGGVKIIATAEEAAECARQMLGQVLVTKQTGPDGRLVKRLLVTLAPVILKEYYLAVLLDLVQQRAAQALVAQAPCRFEHKGVGLGQRLARLGAPAIGAQGQVVRPPQRDAVAAVDLS